MSKKINLLLAEDDENLGILLSNYLKAKNFEVTLARNGQEAFDKFSMERFDFLVLDIMMPEMDGFTLAKEIRETDKHIPILFLSAKGMKEDKLQGFEIGADDYLTKPFQMEELVARINAIYNRVAQKEINSEEATLLIGNLKFEPEKRLLHLPNELRKLTTKESSLLELLVKNKDEILDRQATLRLIWGDDNYFNGRSMDVYIAKLRKLLKNDERIEIMNVHGKGFKLIVA